MYQIDAVRLGPRCLDEIGDVRFGSKADIGEGATDVRFTPKSGHWNSAARCPLCAKSGHGTSHYPINSSARPRSDCGTVRSRTLAVARLITSSYFVGACTAKSAGFSPLRTRST